jgi:hypothetical protein
MYQLFPEGPVNTICKLLDLELVNVDEKQIISKAVKQIYSSAVVNRDN